MVDDTNMSPSTTTSQLVAEASSYWRKDTDSNLYQLMDVYNGHMGMVSMGCQTVANMRSMGNAQGEVLDQFGQDRNTYRTSNDDELYRFTIYIKYLLANATGTVPSIGTIASQAFNRPHGITIYRSGTRHIVVKLPLDDVNDIKTEKLIAANIKQLVALGIWLDSISFVSATSSQEYYGVTTLSHESVKLTAV